MSNADERPHALPTPAVEPSLAPVCRVCTSPLRPLIEDLLARGLTWKMTAEGLPAGSGLSAAEVRGHLESGHMPVLESAAVGLAVTVGPSHASTEPDAPPVGDPRRLARAVIASVASRVEAGSALPTVHDGLRAAALLGDEAPTYDDEREAWVEAFLVQEDIIRSLVPDETYRTYLDACTKNETIMRLHEEQRFRQSGTEARSQPYRNRY